MKIRQDFITNSSSTSFIISLKSEFTKENFLEALGVSGNPLVADFFDSMFEVINQKKSAVSKSIKSRYGTLDEYLKWLDLDEDQLDIVNKFLADNHPVYVGDFYDIESGMEYYLHQERIKIHGDNILFFSPERQY
jgi:hypothetical protein